MRDYILANSAAALWIARQLHCGTGRPWPRRPSTRARRPGLLERWRRLAPASTSVDAQCHSDGSIGHAARVFASDEALDPELLENRVTSGLHSQRLIGALRGLIGVFDVEPKADHVGVATRFLLDVLIERAKDPAAAIRLGDIDALQPPDPAVAPVAPFAGDRGLADNTPRSCRSRRPSSAGARDQPVLATRRKRMARSRTFPSVSSARHRLNSTIAGTVGKRCVANRAGWRSGRSNAVAPADACATACLLQDPKLFFGQAGAAFAGDLGEHFIELGVELLLGDDRDRRRLARAPHGRRRSRRTRRPRPRLLARNRREDAEPRLEDTPREQPRPAQVELLEEECKASPGQVGLDGDVRGSSCQNGEQGVEPGRSSTSTHIGIGMKKNRISRLG